jgi:opacity protein-like surface antigen
MRKTFLTAALLAAMPFAASAADLPMSYTYVEGGYAHLKIKSDTLVQINGESLNDPSADGAYIRGSFAIAEQVYVFGGYSEVSRTDRTNIGGGYVLKTEITVDQPEIGIGYHMPFTDRLDFITDLSYQRLGLELKAAVDDQRASDKDHTGLIRVGAGVRGKPSPRTEAWIKASYFDGSDVEYLFDNQFVGTAGLQVSFNKTWGIVGEAQFYDGAIQSAIGVRASF